MKDTHADELTRGRVPGRFTEVVDNMSIGYLAIVLAITSLGGALRSAEPTSQPPEIAGQYIQVIAAIVWTMLVVLALFRAPLSTLRSVRR